MLHDGRVILADDHHRDFGKFFPQNAFLYPYFVNSLSAKIALDRAQLAKD